MKKLLSALIIGGMFLAPSTAISDAKQMNDELLEKKIVGTWRKGENPYGITTFNKNGRYEAKIYMSTDQSELLQKIEGEWWINDGILYNKLTKSEPEILVVGEKIVVDKILGINDTKLALINGKGKRYAKTRVK
jgi:hypothetical protein